MTNIGVLTAPERTRDLRTVGFLVALLPLFFITAIAAPRADGSTDSAHWSLQPLAVGTPPRLADPWVRTPVDAFVLAKMREHGLEPSAPAPPARR